MMNKPSEPVPQAVNTSVSNTSVPLPTSPTTDSNPVFEEEPIDTSNFYIFGDPRHDSDRLIAQARLFGDYVQQNAYRLLQSRPEHILDIGCGEGQITTVFSRLFKNAHVVGVDIDPKAIDAATQRLKRVPGITPQN